jgi:hypothetical protein
MTNDDIGPQRVGDRRGWLVFDSLPAYLQRREDATQDADHRRVAADEYAATSYARLASATERQLLTHLGYTLPDVLNTRVQWLSNGLRHRDWPQLEGTQT